MKPYSLEFDAIGTHWRIDCQCVLSQVDWENIAKSIFDRIEVFDQTYSRFRQDSLVSEMARTGGTFDLPTDGKELFTLYESLYQLTDGAFTPLIGNMLSDSGYDAHYSLEEKDLRVATAWDDALSYDFPKLTIAQNEILDFGAGGKGYLIDIVSGILELAGIQSYCVDAGGDIVQKSAKNKALRIGLEHPIDTSLAVGVASICNQSIAGSSGNRRKWGKYHHIFDPSTRDSTRDVLATWVVAPTGILADALATCLFLVEPQLLRDYFFEFLILYPDMTILKSANFPAELFLS